VKIQGDLTQFLKECSESGVFESSGAFQVDTQAGREKLRVFQNQIHIYALLMLIQGLVSLKASSLEVRILPNEIEVKADVKVSAGEVQEAYAARAGLCHSPLGMVAAGINAALSDPGTSVYIETDGESWEVREGATHRRDYSGFLFRQVFRTKGLSLSRIFTRTSIFHDLQKRCRFVPCSFLLDGSVPEPDHGIDFPGTPRLEWFKQGEGFRFVVDDLTPHRWEDGAYIWNRIQPERLSWRRSFRTPSMMVVGLEQGFREKVASCDTVFSVFDVDFKQSGQVKLLRHGVVCEARKHSSLLPNSVTLVDVTDFDSDLSGLRIVLDERFQKLLRELLHPMSQAAELIIAQYPSLCTPYAKSAFPAYSHHGPGIVDSFLRKNVRPLTGWTKSKSGVMEEIQILRDWLEQTRVLLESEEAPAESIPFEISR
jgi:hypothetical protein